MEDAQNAGAGPDAQTGPHIFLIGPNRCGTTSFWKFFSANGIACAHWEYQGRRLGPEMMNNLALGRPLMHGFDGIVAFCDMNYFREKVPVEGMRLFPLLARDYPDAYFILNLRDPDKWIKSRVNFGMVSRLGYHYGMEEPEVTELWRKMLETHVAQVRAFFQGNPRFLEFNIETDTIDKVATLLAPHYRIDPALFGVTNTISEVRKRAARRKKQEQASKA